LFAVLTMFVSFDPELTLGRAASLALMYLAIFWGAWRIADRSGPRFALALCLAVCAAVVVAGFAAVPTGNVWFGSRFCGIFFNPNALGLFLAILFPAVLERVLATRRWHYIGLFGLMLVSLVLSGSRGGVLSALLGLGYVSWRFRPSRLVPVLLVLAAAAWLFVPWAEWSEEQDRLLRPDTVETGSGRVEAWAAAVELIEDRPVFGYGFGTEELLFHAFQFEGGFRQHQGSYVHNSYLGLATQVGWVGMLTFFVPLLILLLRSLWRSRLDPDLKWHNGIEGALIAGLVACTFESWVYSMGSAHAFPFWLCVMLLVRENEVRRAAGERQGELARMARKAQVRGRALAIGRV
jgi:O-antigen ligase